MLIELTFGVSALMASTGVEMPALMQLATDPERKAVRYKGVDFVPMDYDNVRVVSVDLLEDYFRLALASHGLTVVDAVWPHPLSDALADRVDLWIVTACARKDTVVNAGKLAGELSARYSPDKVWLLQNRAPRGRGGETADGGNAVLEAAMAAGYGRAGSSAGDVGYAGSSPTAGEETAISSSLGDGMGLASSVSAVGLQPAAPGSAPMGGARPARGILPTGGWHIRIPEVGRADDYDGKLGSIVLSRVFAPVWESYRVK